jgi:hypothetical protein
MRMALGADWKVRPTDELLARLRNVFNDDQVKVVY